MKRMLQNILVITVLVIARLWKGFVDLLTKSYRPKRNPKYLIYAGADNGFMAAYRGYFALDGNDFHVMRESVYYKIKGRGNYESFKPAELSVDVTANGEDPKTWEFRPRLTDKENFDKDAIIDLARRMNVKPTKYFSFQVYEFDGYKSGHACNTDQDGYGTILDQKNALFREGNELKLPKKVKMISFREFYRLSE